MMLILYIHFRAFSTGAETFFILFERIVDKIEKLCYYIREVEIK